MTFRAYQFPLFCSMTPTLLRILVFFGLTGMLACVPLREPEFRSLDNFKVQKFGFEESSLTLSLNYYNPNKSGMKLKNAEGDAWADDQFLGHFMIDTLVTIPPKGNFEIPLKMQVSTGAMLKTSLLTLGNKEITFRIDGKAKVGKGNLFIRYPIRYTGKHRLSDMMSSR